MPPGSPGTQPPGVGSSPTAAQSALSARPCPSAHSATARRWHSPAKRRMLSSAGGSSIAARPTRMCNPRTSDEQGIAAMAPAATALPSWCMAAHHSGISASAPASCARIGP